MKLEFFIGFRYLLAKNKKANLVSIISFLCVFAVFLGVFVPIIVISVMSGFQNEIREKILATTSHVFVSAGSSIGIRDYGKLVDEIKAFPDVVSVTPYIETQGLIRQNNNYIPVLIRGIDQAAFTEDQEFNKVFKMVSGEKDLTHRYYIIPGNEIAENNFIYEGARLDVWVAKKTYSPDSQPQRFSGYVVGTFKTGYYDYDNGVIYTSLKTLQKVLNYDDSVTKLGIKVKNIYNVDKLATKLEDHLRGFHIVYTWKEANRNLFKALSLEKIMMWLIVVLILVVAIFNVMSSQIMLVIEKKKEIGILKAMGMSPVQVMKIFLIEGIMITSIGSISGAVLGVLFAANIVETINSLEWFLNIFVHIRNFIGEHLITGLGTAELIKLFPKGVYYLDAIPVDIDPTRVIMVVVTAVLLSILAGFIPSSRAALLKPVQVIRYE